MRTVDLRIGICECEEAKQFQGQFDGRPLGISSTYLMREVPIDEYSHKWSLHINKAHFFLDVHREGHPSEFRTIASVALSLVWLDCFGYVRSGADIDGDEKFSYRWNHCYPSSLPTVTEIEKKIAVMIPSFPSLEYWLKNKPISLRS